MGASVLLADGRRLGYGRYGRSGGRPVLYFHGHPGSRLEAALLADAADRCGVEITAVDRPGLGLSDFQQARRVLDWPRDVTELADALGLERFAVLGFSGGGPYALACAAWIPERIDGCAVVAGVGVLSPLLAFLGSWMPYLVLPVVRRLFFRDQEQARALLRRFAGRWAGPDRRILDDPAVADALAASLAEAFRSGTGGAARDGVLVSGDWRIPTEALAVQRFVLWHGELDLEIPVASARALAARLPACEPHFVAGEGHLSLLVNRGEEILASIAP